MNRTAIRRRALSLWWTVVASDPGLQRLHMAGRATLTAAFAMGVLYALGTFDGQPAAALLLGIVIALMASVMVRAPSRRERKITTLILPLSAAMALTLGSWLAASRIAGDAAFVGIIFVAVYLRRFGPRGFALGMLGFITYFFSLFLDAGMNQLPWLLMAAVVGVACAYVVRFVLWPDAPRRRLVRVVRAFRARVGALLAAVREVVAAGADDETHRRRMRRRAAQMSETALMAEDELQSLSNATSRALSGDQNVAARLFDLELAANRVAVASGEQLRGADRDAVMDLLRRLQERVNQAQQTPQPRLQSVIGALSQQSMRIALDELHQALQHLPDEAALRHPPAQAEARGNGSEDAQNGPSTDTDTDSHSGADENEDTDSGAHESGQRRLRPSTRQAIQVAVAGALAIVAGEFISPHRWYWCVITAFIVFTGTSSRGQTLAKGWQRVAGTLLGVAAGILVATAVGGRAELSTGLMFACIFLAFYSLPISYGLMIFWVTIMLSLLYGMRGMFSVHLLTLRLEETAAGALIGILTAIFVLPTSTSGSVRQASLAYLDRLADLVAACGQRLAGQADAHDPMNASRHLDQAFQQLRGEADPLTRDLAGTFGRRHRSRHWLRALLACRHHARRLAQLARDAPTADRSSPAAEAFADAATGMAARIRALPEPSSSEDSRNTDVDDALIRLHDALRQDHAAQREAARCLQHLHRLVLSLSRDFNVQRMQR